MNGAFYTNVIEMPIHIRMTKWSPIEQRIFLSIPENKLDLADRAPHSRRALQRINYWIFPDREPHNSGSRFTLAYVESKRLKQAKDSYGLVPRMQVSHELGSTMFIRSASTNQRRTSSGECTP